MEKKQPVWLVDCDGTIRKPIAGKKHISPMNKGLLNQQNIL
jgi:hypothetical protein